MPGNGREMGPRDEHGWTRSTDGAVIHAPGDPNLQRFERNGVRWIRLGDGREYEEEKFARGLFDGTIQCGINPLNWII